MNRSFDPIYLKRVSKVISFALLAGVCGDERAVQAKVDRLFGHTTEPGVLKLYWESEFLKNDKTLGEENTLIYETKGKLYLDAPKPDLPFVQKVIEFAFNMGGFGKSWRRVWHDEFLPDYKTRAIGCHWTCNYNFSNIEPTAISNPDDLKAFLTELHEAARNYMGVKANATQCLSWKEAWCPGRLSVYTQVVSQSKAITLFHEPQFKTTPAIGGRSPQ
jgi:CRISPR-associated protein Cmr6